MLSVKMKVKKIIILFHICFASLLNAEIIKHTLISITEKTIMGHLFKHIITSGGLERDEFYIDNQKVEKQLYLKEIDIYERKEREQVALHDELARRSRVDFIDMVQKEIIAKLLDKIVIDIISLFDRIENPALTEFFVFKVDTIQSSEQFIQLKEFVQQLHLSFSKKNMRQDYEHLHNFFTTLEVWPDRLEKFFQDTIQHAIKKSDDTAMLKELLSLVSVL